MSDFEIGSDSCSNDWKWKWLEKYDIETGIIYVIPEGLDYKENKCEWIATCQYAYHMKW